MTQLESTDLYGRKQLQIAHSCLLAVRCLADRDLARVQVTDLVLQVPHVPG
jgi:hypothetical protein